MAMGRPARSVPQVPALYRRVEEGLHDLALSMVDTFLDEIPLYQRLPREQVEGEITSIVEDNLRIFFRTLREGRAPTEEELAEPRASAQRRAEERLPLEAVLSAYHLGGRIGWEALVRAARPDEQDVLVRAASGVLLYIQHVTGAVATAYLEEQQAIYGEERDARRSLARALLAGEPAEELASRANVVLASAYVVGALRLPSCAKAGAVTAVVAARRRVRRLQAALDDYAKEPVVALLDGSGGTFLLPASPDGADAVEGQLAQLVSLLAGVTDVPVTLAGAVAGSPQDVPRAAAQATDVLDLVHRLERPPGAYRLSDVLVEYQLSRGSDALPLLAQALQPLERNPDLLATLDVYLAHDQDRRSTAAALHVHPNTLDYRLRRISELTGLDLSTTYGLQVLLAALTARRLGAVRPD